MSQLLDSNKKEAIHGDGLRRDKKNFSLETTSQRQPNLKPYYEEQYEGQSNFVCFTTESFRDEVGEMSEYDQMIAQRLAARAFHLPGNSFCQDWMQFLGNNHPILGFCMADRRHPFGRRERIINLISSLAFGLATTSLVVLYYYYYEREPDDVVLSYWEIEVQHGLITKLFLTGAINVAYDQGLWFVQSCPCLRGPTESGSYLSNGTKKCCITLGSYLAIEITLLSMCVATYCLIVRASINHDGEDEGITYRVHDYLFLLTYMLQVFISHFVMFPIGAFTIFSGVLGCGRIPGFGGRPFQVWMLERRKLRQDAVEFKDSNSFVRMNERMAEV